MLSPTITRAEAIYKKVVISCLQQAGERNFSFSHSRNLGSTF